MPHLLPRITIITPCFNDAKYIKETLESIHGQNYPNLQHIVVDGGSTDGSVDVIRQYSDKLSWWCSERDKGHGDALAKGFAHADGDIVTWVCSDDLLLPNSLARVGGYFAAHPSCRWLCGDGLLIDDEDQVIDHVFVMPQSHRTLLFWQFWGVVQPAIFFSSRAVVEAGGIDGTLNLSPDFDLVLRVARGGPSDRIKFFLAGLRLYANTQSVLRKAEMHAVDQQLRDRDGFQNVAPPLRALLYAFYNQKFLAIQRGHKLLMRLGLGRGRDYVRSTHWRSIIATICP